MESLQVFCRVVELGSFSRAADQLDVSNASITNHVSRLERHLGVRLLNRTTRKLSLTDDGLSCYQRAKQLIADMTAMEEEFRGAKLTPKGVLRVDVPTTIGRLYVAPALPKFLAQYPELTVKVTVRDRVVDAVEEAVDVLIRVGELRDSGMVARTVHRSRYVCCASPEYLARHGAPRSPNELAQFSCVGFTHPTTGQSVPWVFEKEKRRIVYTPASRIWINHAEAVIGAAMGGGGIIQLLSLSLNPLIAAGTLKPILTDWSAIGPSISVLYAQKRHVPAKVRAFAAFVGELFS